MNVNVPDPNPGRCLNFRRSKYHPGMIRCLDYENVPHICSFEVEKPPLITHDHSAAFAYMKDEPKPWVKPD